MKKYNEDIATIIDCEYQDITENLFAEDVARDLSDGVPKDEIWEKRSHGIIRYYRGQEARAKEIFNGVCQMME